jgi:hypothetical protein
MDDNNFLTLNTINFHYRSLKQTCLRKHSVMSNKSKRYELFSLHNTGLLLVFSIYPCICVFIVLMRQETFHVADLLYKNYFPLYVTNMLLCRTHTILISIRTHHLLNIFWLTHQQQSALVVVVWQTKDCISTWCQG